MTTSLRSLALGATMIAASATSALAPATAHAQHAPVVAPQVLANVQHFYARIDHYTAQFRQVVTNATFNNTHTSDGRLWVAKPTSVRFDYLVKRAGAVVPSKSFVFDGTTLSIVDHDNKQVTQTTTPTSALPAAMSFLTGGAALAQQFSVALNTTGTYGGAHATVLELTPKQPSAQYKQLFFVVDPADSHITESIVIDANGDTNDFKLYAPDAVSPVKPTLFQVNVANLPGYDIVVPKPAMHAAQLAPAQPAPSATP